MWSGLMKPYPATVAYRDNFEKTSKYKWLRDLSPNIKSTAALA
jgi:hypothetical protein